MTAVQMLGAANAPQLPLPAKAANSELLSVNISKYCCVNLLGLTHSSWHKTNLFFVHSVREKGPYGGQFYGSIALAKRKGDVVYKALVVNLEPWILVLALSLTDKWSVDLRFLIHKRWMMIPILQVVVKIRAGIFKSNDNVSEHGRPARNGSY